MERSDQTITDTRKDLLSKMLKKSNAAKVVSKSVTFTNSDVPNFLKKLRRFEKESAKVNHEVR